MPTTGNAWADGTAAAGAGGAAFGRGRDLGGLVRADTRKVPDHGLPSV
jgi:hypothetical protein